MKYRIADPSDAPALVAIYASYVKETFITFEYDVPTISEFSERIASTLTRYPYFVAEENDEIFGYTYASAFKSRAAYDWSVETSIYVSMAHRRNGVGHILYEVLERALHAQNVCNICACISFPNPESISFHEAFGYKTVAHFTNSGYKLGAWHDMVWMEKNLCPYTNPPKSFVPFSQLPKKLFD